MPDSLNPRQRQILDFLRDHSRDHSYPPTVREIGRAVGLSSSSTVQNHLNTLETRGYITRDPAKSRTVEIVDAAGQSRGSRATSSTSRLVGRVAAGTPVLAVENVEEHLDVGTEIAGGDDSYALTVHGESMIDAGIRDGDIVVVRPRRDPPANGTIVVARIENDATGEQREVTVKRFFRESRTRASAAGEQRRWSRIYAHDVTLEGVVVAVIRLGK